eukprot:CAMPEP_0182915206 /NCGR_PEP_ID=MMETSP0105_2-20130417/175_1 /TAXON_ID=81532 ORGANISM="Acanthoeca-like sp., Strain 10tr" /NCGR_SAMPLE_ID=MMETSP0105_2 /ASSEMBLY_ACC=CAM_ASM_000205 /LENGTH=178 /DNA_ID=CAMNT_0025052043 /DNA_START=16 /DNA_END=552 /DNA_ORIENTATION=+
MAFSGLLRCPLLPMRALPRCSVAVIAGPRFVQTDADSSKWVGLIEDQKFFDKNKKMNRPMSPHLTIYRPQLTSILSITHRGTGVGLTLGMSAAGIALGTQAFGGPPLEYWLDIAQTYPSWMITGAKFTIAWPFAYHFANGIRHLFWDMGYGFNLKVLYQSGWGVVGIATVAAAAITAL